MPPSPTTVVGALEHPPYGILTRETLGPLTAGLTTVHRTRGPIGVDAFGVSFDFFTIPAAFGSTQQVHLDYEVPIVEFAPLYTMLDGHQVYGHSQVLTHEGDLYFFDQLLPTQVDVWVQVGCTVILFFLVAL
jgi:hypothetical protein